MPLADVGVETLSKINARDRDRAQQLLFDMRLVKWMVAANLALTLAIVARLFVMHQ